MLLKGKQLLVSFLVAFTLVAAFGYTPVAHATGSGTKVTTSNVEGITSSKVTYGDGTSYDPNGEVPSVTIDQATNWADRKGKDATNFLQVGGQWFAIIMFIVSAVMTLFGAIAGKVSKGLIGIFFSIIMYTGITFAPMLIDFFSQWLAS